VTLSAMPDDRPVALAPLDEKVDHVRGSPAGRLIIEYGDYECPYSRQAFHAIEQVDQQLGRNVRFAFRHFPADRYSPARLAAAAAAEAAARQSRFWDMHELLFHRQKALEDGHLREYASQLGLDVVTGAPAIVLSYPWTPLHLRAPGPVRYPRRRHGAPAVHRRHRGEREGGTRYGRPDPST
jgi:hypothetical protein